LIHIKQLRHAGIEVAESGNIPLAIRSLQQTEICACFHAFTFVFNGRGDS
jgi:hypothetical protein